MKKLSLVLIILLAFGAAIFADDAAEVTMPTVEEAVMAIDDLATVKGLLAPSVEGSATLTFGISLDDPMMTGFTNASSSSLSLTLVPEATVSSGTIGYIEIADYSLGLDTTGATGSAGSVTAKLVFGPLSIAVSSAPTVVADAAAYNVAADTGVAGGGTTITYAMDTMSFGLQVASDGDWTANAGNAYAIGVVADVTVSIISLPIEFAYNLDNSNMGVSIAPSVDLDPLTIDLAFDMAMDTGADMAWDMSAGVTLAGPDDDTSTSLSVLMNSIETDDIMISLAFAENGDVDAGYIGVIGAAFGFNLTLSTDVVWDTSVSVDYDDGSGISPDAAFTYNSAGTMTLTAGCDFGAALTGFDNTTIAVDYGTLTIADGVDPLLGDLTIAVTIDY